MDEAFFGNHKQLIVDFGCGRRKRCKGGELFSNYLKNTTNRCADDLTDKYGDQFKINKDFSSFKDLHEKYNKAFSLYSEELKFYEHAAKSVSLIGIDANEDSNPDLVCKLGYERIPLEDSVVDYAIAADFLEHLPLIDGKKRPVQFFVDEVYRVLKNGAYFELWIPCFGKMDNRKVFVPYHRSYWSDRNDLYDTVFKKYLQVYREVRNGKIWALFLKYE